MRTAFAVFLILSTALFSAAAAEPKVSAGTGLLGDAIADLQAGRLDAALAKLDQFDKNGKATGLALDVRGCVYLEQQKLDEAIKAFRAAHEADASLYTPRLHIGDALLRQHKWEEARDAYQTTMKETNVLVVSERLRYAAFLTYLGAKDDAGAKTALERLVFPTETPAYYYGQAAWDFAHGDSKGAKKWMNNAEKIYDAKKTAWFARPFYDFGWIKTKPPVVVD